MKKIVQLLMLLLIVFAAIQCGGSEQPQPQPQPQPAPNPAPSANADFEAIRKQINSDLLFRIEVYNFPPDSWVMPASMYPTMDKLAEILNRLINMAKKINAADKIKITVIGYSDTTGTQARKMTVSENRAKQVIVYLVTKKNFQQSYFNAQWRGDQELKVSEDPLSPKNRRVIVYFEGIRN